MRTSPAGDDEAPRRGGAPPPRSGGRGLSAIRAEEHSWQRSGARGGEGRAGSPLTPKSALRRSGARGGGRGLCAKRAEEECSWQRSVPTGFRLPGGPDQRSAWKRGAHGQSYAQNLAETGEFLRQTAAWGHGARRQKGAATPLPTGSDGPVGLTRTSVITDDLPVMIVITDDQPVMIVLTDYRQALPAPANEVDCVR